MPPPFDAIKLTLADAGPIAALFARCSDHFLLQDGVEADPSDAVALFRDVPTGKSATDQTIFGWRDDSGLYAVAAMLRDYPEDGVWYLGLLLLDPRRRGQGVGRALHEALVRHVIGKGAREFRLAVIEANVGAERFWRSLGYRERRRVGLEAFKARQQRRVEMTRDLRPPQNATCPTTLPAGR